MTKKKPRPNPASEPQTVSPDVIISTQDVGGSIQVSFDSIPEPSEKFYANTIRVEQDASKMVNVSLGLLDPRRPGRLIAVLTFEIPPLACQGVVGTINAEFRQRLASAGEGYGEMIAFGEVGEGVLTVVSPAHYFKMLVNENWCRLDFYELGPEFEPSRLRISPLFRVRTTVPVVAHLVERLEELTKGKTP